MPRKQTSPKSSTERKLVTVKLRELLSAMPGSSKANREDEVARSLSFLKNRPELKARLVSGEFTAEQLLNMVRTRTSIAMGEASDEHTRRELDRYLGSLSTV